MNRKTKPLKPYHGIIVLIVTAVIVFGIDPILKNRMGLYGALIGELLMLVIAVGCARLFGGNLKYVFPVQKPTLPGLFGTFLIWMGAVWITLCITSILSYFFPNEIIQTGQGLSSSFLSVPAVVSILIIAVAPAFCEEAVFRGVVFNSFWPIGNKWIVIVLTGCIFGIYHGSIWRFLPTAILGMVMAYLLAETGNMVYNAFFHGINNLLPLLMAFGLQWVVGMAYRSSDGLISSSAGSVANSFSLAAAGIYLAGAGIAFLLIYAGNFLIHMGQNGYKGKLFEGHRRKHLYILIGIAVGCLVLGCLLVLASAAASVLGQMIHY